MDILMTRKLAAVGLKWPFCEPYEEIPTIIPLDIILYQILPFFPRDWLYVSLKCQSMAFPQLLNDPRIDPRSKSGDSPIMEASKRGYLRVVKLFARDPLVNVRKHVKQALEESLKHGHIQVFDFLFTQMLPEQQADLNYLFHLLDVSIQGDHYLMVEHFIKKQFGRTLLHNIKIYERISYAVRKGNYHITKLLLKNTKSRFALSFFVVNEITERNDYQMLKLLQKSKRVTVQSNLYDYETPMHIAARKGYLECVKILLVLGYTPLEEHIRSEIITTTPITEAMIHRQLEVLELFKDHPSIGEEKEHIEQYLSNFSYN